MTFIFIKVQCVCCVNETISLLLYNIFTIYSVISRDVFFCMMFV